MLCSHLVWVRPGFCVCLPDSQGKSGLLLALESLFWKPPTFWRDFCRSTRKSRTFPRQLLPSVTMQVSQLQPGPSSYSKWWCSCGHHFVAIWIDIQVSVCMVCVQMEVTGRAISPTGSAGIKDSMWKGRGYL